MFERVAIIGVGLLGTSLALAIKARNLAGEVVGVGRAGSPSLSTALDRRAIDRAFTHLGDALALQPDLVILCVPVRQYPELLKTIRGQLKSGAIVTDVGSTKAQVMAWADEHLASDPAIFVGSHPMAGSEKRGPAAARADLFEGALCLLCEPAQDAAGATEKVAALWRAVGMRTMILRPENHDQWVATISHLPHAIAASLMNTAAGHPEMLAAAAGGFTDTTRIAASDVDMWTDIFLTNRDAVLAAIDEFSDELASLKNAIRKADEPNIRVLLTKSKEARETFASRRKTD